MQEQESLYHYGIKGMRWGKKKKQPERDMDKESFDTMVSGFAKILSSPTAKALLVVPIADAVSSGSASLRKYTKRSRYVNRTMPRAKLTNYRVD